MDASPHLNPSALSLTLERLTDIQGGTKSAVAREAGMTPANLREYETGVRTGSSSAVRGRIAGALSVPVESLTCWCDRPEGRCRNLPGVPS